MLVTHDDIRPGSMSKKLLRSDLTLYVDSATEAALYHYLSPGDHTFATLSTNIDREIVKITMTCGQLLLDRAQNVAPPAAFPPGSCISFELTTPAVKELIACAEVTP